MHRSKRRTRTTSTPAPATYRKHGRNVVILILLWSSTIDPFHLVVTGITIIIIISVVVVTVLRLLSTDPPPSPPLLPSRFPRFLGPPLVVTQTLFASFLLFSLISSPLLGDPCVFPTRRLSDLVPIATDQLAPLIVSAFGVALMALAIASDLRSVSFKLALVPKRIIRSLAWGVSGCPNMRCPVIAAAAAVVTAGRYQSYRRCSIIASESSRHIHGPRAAHAHTHTHTRKQKELKRRSID